MAETYHEWNTGIKQNFIELKQAFASKDGAVDMWMSNFLFLKIFGSLFLIAMVIVNCYFHKVRRSLLTEKPATFAYESAVFAVCSVVPFMLVYFLRKDDTVRNNLPGGKMAIDMIIFFVVFFALNYLLELSGFYALAFGYDRDEETLPPEATCAPRSSDASEFGESFLWTSALYLGIGFLFCAFVIIVFVPLRVWDTCYHYSAFGFDWSKSNFGSMGLFFVEMILFGCISAVAIYLMAWNRGRLDATGTTDEFGLIASKFALLHIILQMSGFYNVWLRNEKPSVCAVHKEWDQRASDAWTDVKTSVGKKWDSIFKKPDTVNVEVVEMASFKFGGDSKPNGVEYKNEGSSWWTILPPIIVTVVGMYFLYEYRKKLAKDEEAEREEKARRAQKERAARHEFLQIPPEDARKKVKVDWLKTLAPLGICLVLVVLLSYVKSKLYASH